jgi:hypothetical protein
MRTSMYIDKYVYSSVHGHSSIPEHSARPVVHLMKSVLGKFFIGPALYFVLQKPSPFGTPLLFLPLAVLFLFFLGLDPAGPLFEGYSPKVRLDKGGQHSESSLHSICNRNAVLFSFHLPISNLFYSN